MEPCNLLILITPITSDTSAVFIFDSSAIRTPIKLPVILVKIGGGVRVSRHALRSFPTQDDPAPVDFQVEGEPEPEPYFSGFTAMTRDEMTSHCWRSLRASPWINDDQEGVVAEPSAWSRRRKPSLKEPKANLSILLRLTKAEDHRIHACRLGVHLGSIR